ncbi:MAG: class I SAM-dependent methyltransferase [Ardenticatenia bacterium]|nr:class I SAM-dependent methyltransferase [Ardenticatenia bacterium]
MLWQQLLWWFFDRLYTDLAPGYDLVAWLASGGLWYRWVDVAARFLAGDPVLEVGFGRGRLAVRLAHMGRTVVGLDRSPQMVMATRRLALRAGAPLHLVQGSGDALPFGTATFGTLITTFPAPYVLAPQTQAEFARVLKPGGRWIWVDAPRWPGWPRRPAVLWLFQRLGHLHGALQSKVPHHLAVRTVTVPVEETVVAVRIWEKPHG